VDNSEFTRNGDYTPTRFDAQRDAVALLFNAKTQSNPENTVGLMSMGGNGYVWYLFTNEQTTCNNLFTNPFLYSPAVLATLSSDFGKILSGLHNIKIEGQSHVATGIQVAAVSERNGLNSFFINCHLNA
jgi:26S proteasome regulatory subunit N10